MKRVSVLLSKDKTDQVCERRGEGDPLIGSITYHSASAEKHTAFIALKGTRSDGHLYIEQAIENGANLIIHSRHLSSYHRDVTYLQCSHPQLLAAQIAYDLHGPYPQQLIGITGTDGKSSTAVFLYRFLTASGKKCGLLSTISIDDGSGCRATPYRQSTPEPEVLYPFLSRCYQNGLDTVVLEATSHALSHQTGRLYPLTFSHAIVQTISSEHLDFHQSLEQYVDDKMNLVRQLRERGHVIFSTENRYCSQIRTAMKGCSAALTYSVDAGHSGSTAQMVSTGASLNQRSFTLTSAHQSLSASTAFAPPFFLENIAAAAVTAQDITGKPHATFLTPPSLCEAIEGRYQVVPCGDNRFIIIDFAHTPDAFEKLFSFIHSLEPSVRLIALFSSAGRRDRGKRLPLGLAAGRFCSRIYLTEEDSRDEDVHQIWADIEEGISRSGFDGIIERIEERETAVRTAIGALRGGEVLLVLGKGHEKSIERSELTYAYNETELVYSIVNEESKI
ncbi:MAG: UDP-N-acetylmuramyl-tripeptide synthetase [Sphaerochaetaceae bacterium]|nr:UDP-N-acetylmuramyl-tripeptide synthetase [Sphaerochaetaceae bacterium]